MACLTKAHRMPTVHQGDSVERGEQCMPAMGLINKRMTLSPEAIKAMPSKQPSTASWLSSLWTYSSSSTGQIVGASHTQEMNDFFFGWFSVTKNRDGDDKMVDIFTLIDGPLETLSSEHGVFILFSASISRPSVYRFISWLPFHDLIFFLREIWVWTEGWFNTWKQYFVLAFLCRAANLYFLLLALLNWVPVVEAFQKEITMIPLLVVLSVIAIKDAIEDYRRYLSDKKVNSNVVQVFCG